MRMTSSVVVKSDLERVWAFLSNESNAPRWDRSVARADLISSPLLIPVLALFKRALGADLDSLRRAIDEGHDLTAVTRP